MAENTTFEPKVHKSRPIKERFLNTREKTISLCAGLSVEDHVPQAAEFASPVKWHLAHTTWFFEQFILREHLPGYKIFNEEYNHLFNSYYRHHGQPHERGKRGVITRPGVYETYKYRSYVDQHMVQMIEKDECTPDVASLVTLGINHEQQHQELLVTDLKYLLSLNPVNPVYSFDPALCEASNSGYGWQEITGGMIQIGHDGNGFCYDNERPQHMVHLPEFMINRALVTNAEYLAFMEDNGYGRVNLWLDDGWSHIQQNNITHPLYWRRKKDQWYHFTLAGERPVDPENMLCHVSFYEADAFARWAGLRLPTEFEWEAAAAKLTIGERWEWTNSAYLPYPGYKTPEGAVGEYNGKFMVNQKVLKGASAATTEGHSKWTYRNFFHPHLRWQFTGIRLAK